MSKPVCRIIGRNQGAARLVEPTLFLIVENQPNWLAAGIETSLRIPMK